MTVVKFLRDFQGLSSNWRYYLAGETVDLPDEVATACLVEGVVVTGEVPPLETGVAVSSSTATPAVTPTPARKTATKRAAKKAVK